MRTPSTNSRGHPGATRLCAGRSLLAAPLALAGAAALGIGVPPATGAGTELPVKADLRTTGNDSELVKAVPIATAPDANQRTVMSLDPDELPRLKDNDRVRVNGEVQVSTTCVRGGLPCIGRRYEFNPMISAQIFLSPSPQPEGQPRVPISELRNVRCKQRRPNRNHHCTLAFPSFEFAVDTSVLPCPPDACYVNMVLGAWHRKASRGNRVVLGGDSVDDSVVQDKGRLNVAVNPALGPAPTALASNLLVNGSLPLTAAKKLKRRVVHSVEIPAARDGDVLAFDANYQASIEALPYNTFIGTRVILTDSPTSTEPGNLGKEVANLGGHATETNGFNCTQGPSGYPTPCTVVKAGAIRIKRDPVDAVGNPVPVYLNMVATAKPLLARNPKPADEVVLIPLEGLRVARYAPN